MNLNEQTSVKFSAKILEDEDSSQMEESVNIIENSLDENPCSKTSNMSNQQQNRGRPNPRPSAQKIPNTINRPNPSKSPGNKSPAPQPPKSPAPQPAKSPAPQPPKSPQNLPPKPSPVQKLSHIANPNSTNASKRAIKMAKKRARARSTADLKENIKMDEHIISLEELCARLQTDMEKGLQTSKANYRLIEEGPNALTPPKTTPQWLIFLKNMTGGFSLLLWLGALLCIVAFVIESKTSVNIRYDNLYLGIVLAAVVILSGCFTYFQESKSSKIMESFNKMVPQMAVVVRDGNSKSIPATDLVCGDLIQVKSGDRVPADIRVVTSSNFKVDNSALTGESEPQTRANEEGHKNPLESKNLAFFSTNCVEGSATGIVVKTGDNTVMGRIANLTSNLGNQLTPLGMELNRFIRIITVVALLVGITCLILALQMRYTWIEATLFLIGVIVAMVPEGLLPTVTVSLALTARRMASKNCVVRNLEAVETLGSTSTICSDKTGTLTQNRMSVAHLWYDGQIYDESDPRFNNSFPGWQGRKENTKNANNADPSGPAGTYQALGRSMMLCSRASFEHNQKHVPILRRACVGDASESAFLKFMEIHVGDVAGYRELFPKVAEVPFNSTNKYQLSIHNSSKADKNNALLMVMKGAPERIIARCSTIMIEGVKQPITAEIMNGFQNSYMAMGGMGERVLGFCEARLPTSFTPNTEFNIDKPNFPIDNMCFIGLVSLIDPPRASVPEAVLKCRKAGIQVVMVTGDHPITAKAIARSVNIISPNSRTVEEIAEQKGISAAEVDPKLADACVIHGETLSELNQTEFDELLLQYKELVFARTSPTQKLLIVEGFQRMGRFVAVTGDGVNDSPALKKANIGIAMGITGSDVSKQAADMILLDDNFSTIVAGIEEGRIIFDNLKKSIAYTLTSKVPELAPFVMFMLLDLPLFLGTVTILCIDLGTDMFPAISMAYETPESDIMSRNPRDPKKDRLVNSRLMSTVFLQIGVIQGLSLFWSAFVVMTVNGFFPSKLKGIRAQWTDRENDLVEDSYGQEWSYEERLSLQYTVYASSFMSVVVAQWADLIICKTRRLSCFQQGFYNRPLVYSLFFETALAVLLQCIPRLNTALQMAPCHFALLLTALPFSAIIFIYDEVRKYILRYHDDGFVYKETYY